MTQLQKIVEYRVLPTLQFLIVFLIPSHFFAKAAIRSAYVHGLLVDYLIPKLFVMDVLVLFSIGVCIWLYIQNQKIKLSVLKKIFKRNWLWIGLLVLLLLRQTLTSHPAASLWFTGELLLLCAWLISWSYKPLPNKLLLISLNLSLLFQTLLGSYQVITQQSLAGYWLLGEPNLAQTWDLSHLIWQGRELILAYGTTAHPNVLAGWAVATWWLSYVLTHLKQDTKTKSTFNKFVSLHSLGCAILCVILTASVSAALSLILLLSLVQLYHHQKQNMLIFRKINLKNIFILWVVSGLALCVFPLEWSNNPSIVRRVSLAKAALEMFSQNVAGGVGFNQFTANLELTSVQKEVIRFIQPVHHILLLWVSETGLLGIILGYKIATWFQQLPSDNRTLLNLTLLGLTPTLIWDHYWLTQHTGLWMMGLVLLYVTNLTRLKFDSSATSM
jgi:hypothetical protein